MTDTEAGLLMGWKGARLFGQDMPPMRDFIPNAYERWYSHLINEVLPAAGEEAMVAFIDAGFDPVLFFRRHAEPRP